MDDLIRREDALKEICEVCDISQEIKPLCEYRFEGCLYGKVYSIPAVDAVEVKHGRWEWIETSDEGCYFCTVCGEHNFYEATYCPDCGAKMDSWYESLKRGLEEAIAYERGEVECRTERREDGDGDG